MDYKYLHSVVETINNKNEPIIIDWTRNLVIAKETYIKLFKFNILSIVNPTKVLQDAIILKKIAFDLKTYLTFRNELMQDISKNPQIFFQEVQNVSSEASKQLSKTKA